jgi:hypothetical protein
MEPQPIGGLYFTDHAATEAALMAKAPKKPLREWRITLIRAKGEYLGRVEAPDAESAIERAIAEFNIDEATCPSPRTRAGSRRSRRGCGASRP